MSFGTIGNTPDLPFGRPDKEPHATTGRPGLDAAGLHILDRDQCLALLGTAGVGALTVTRQALPIALPIGYSVHQGALVVRVAPRSILAHTAQEVVAFCAYAADLATRRGWSVSATGMAHRVTDPAHHALLRNEVRSPWSPGGLDDVFLTLSPASLTGRMVAT